MAQIVVRNLEEDVKRRLKARALRHGRSMEEEARVILRAALQETNSAEFGLGSEIAAMFKGLGLDEDLPELRGQPVRPAKFDD